MTLPPSTQSKKPLQMPFWLDVDTQRRVFFPEKATRAEVQSP